MKTFATDLKRAVLSPIPLTSWGLMSGLVSYAGPFGTYATVPLNDRLLYWSIVIGFAILTGILVRVLVRRMLGGRNYWRNMFVNATLLALLLSHPLRLFSLGAAGELSALVPPFHEMALLIFVVSIGISALRLLVAADRPDPVVPQRAPQAQEGSATINPRLIERLDSSLQGNVVRLQVDDHYVSVVTDKGTGKLLMRFSDAIEELAGVDGLRVHRSHWVAAAAITGHEIEKGRLFLLTSDGARIPVSRNHRTAVAEQGLLHFSQASE